MFVLTGYHSDTTLLASAGVAFDPVELAPQFDPETFETNVPGIYVIGNVTTGRQTGKIFIENGRFHGKRAVDVIAERCARRLASPELGLSCPARLAFGPCPFGPCPFPVPGPLRSVLCLGLCPSSLVLVPSFVPSSSLVLRPLDLGQ